MSMTRSPKQPKTSNHQPGNQREDSQKPGPSKPRRTSIDKYKQPAIIVVIIAAIITALATIIAAYRPGVNNQTEPTPTSQPRSTVATSTTPASLPPSVTITTPKQGSDQPQNITVQGKASNIPSSKVLWLLVQVQGVDGYFPQANDTTNPSPISFSDGTWSVPATIGTSADKGKTFTLITVLVDQNSDAENEIVAYFQQPGSSYVGIQLPPGAEVMGQVSVVRT